MDIVPQNEISESERSGAAAPLVSLAAGPGRLSWGSEPRSPNRNSSSSSSCVRLGELRASGESTDSQLGPSRSKWRLLLLHGAGAERCHIPSN